MNWHFKTIGIVGTHRNPLVAETVEHLISLMAQWGLQAFIENETANALESCSLKALELTKIGEQCDLIIAVGGDGNLLQTARTLSLSDTPVVGINRGELGFLTDILPDRLEEDLKPLLQGKFDEEKRFLIEGLINGNQCEKGLSNALNDIVIFPGEAAQLIEFEIEINGKFVYSQRSDGLIVSTPTGSTAYALSAGGPIVEPHLDVLLLIPKFPHSLTNRPLITHGSNKIQIHIGDYNTVSPKISYDGHSTCTLQAGDIVTIQKQQKPLRLLHPHGYNYYASLRSKLHWGTQLIPLKER